MVESLKHSAAIAPISPGLNVGRRRNLLHSGQLWQGKLCRATSGQRRISIRWLELKILSPRKADMTRADAVARARGYLHSGEFLRDLRSEEHTSELQSHSHLVCRLIL